MANSQLKVRVGFDPFCDNIDSWQQVKNTVELVTKDKNAVVVMAVDNLPCELPKDASEGFGELFLENVIPAFYNNDKNGVLARAKMTENGKLTERFSYLQEYVDGKE